MSVIGIMATDKIISLELLTVQVKAVEIVNKPSWNKPSRCEESSTARLIAIFDDANGLEHRVMIKGAKTFYVCSNLVTLDTIEDCVDEFNKHSKKGKVFTSVRKLGTKYAEVASYLWTGQEEDNPELKKTLNDETNKR